MHAGARRWVGYVLYDKPADSSNNKYWSDEIKDRHICHLGYVQRMLYRQKCVCFEKA
jgi:hypothetical protein